MGKIIKVKLPDGRREYIRKIKSVLTRQINSRGGADVEFVDLASADVVLALSAGVSGVDGFAVTDGDGGTGVRVTGHDERGLLYGIGKMLRTAEYGGGTMAPGAWRGQSEPTRRARMIYFATHFHNFYHDAPIEKIEAYIEDLMLWGYNGLVIWFDMHHFDGVDDPEAIAMQHRLRAMVKAARDLGMEAGMIALANEGYRSTPEAMRAQWHAQNGYREKLLAHYHVEVCPNAPGGMDRILENFDALFQRFEDVGMDLLSIWPYDQGGCTCDHCAPWGATGYLLAGRRVAECFRRYFPSGKVSLSTWWFDYAYPSEWAAFAKAAQGNLDWVDYLLIDAHCHLDFPKYPMAHGVPDDKPVLNFPEISMNGMMPWGGFGANPYPGRLQALWDGAKHLIAGGYPYSEGIYEDMNKAVYARYYWDDAHWTDTVREYLTYYFGAPAAEILEPVIPIMERTMVHRIRTEGNERWIDMPCKEGVKEMFERVQAAEETMDDPAKGSWRWRVMALRARIDAESEAHPDSVSEAADAAFRELTDIYHAHHAHGAVLPPARSASNRSFW